MRDNTSYVSVRNPDLASPRRQKKTKIEHLLVIKLCLLPHLSFYLSSYQGRHTSITNAKWLRRWLDSFLCWFYVLCTHSPSSVTPQVTSTCSFPWLFAPILLLFPNAYPSSFVSAIQTVTPTEVRNQAPPLPPPPPLPSLR